VVRRRGQASTVLSVYVVVLLGIPSILVVNGLGAAGSPATLFGVGLLAWWVISRLRPAVGRRVVQPIHWAIGLLLLSVVTSYVVAGMRGAEAVEQRAADRGLLLILSVAGVALVAADGLRTRVDIDKVLHTTVIMGGVMAVFGLLQFNWDVDVPSLYRSFPLLTTNGVDNAVFDVGVRRVASTAGHPIEFGMVLTLILPIALHRAFSATTTRARRRAWLLAALVAFGIPLSVSRSAVVGLVAAAVVLLPGWPKARRIGALKVVPVFLVVIKVLAPGTLGTLKSGLLNIQNDPSYQGRTDDYAVVGRFIAERPFFGRGFGTFLPDKYTLLDNQYLGTIIEMGFVGLAVVLGLFVVGIGTALLIRRRTSDEATRDLALSLAASLAAAGLGLATFDAFGFSGFTGLLFLLLGCTGALWRLAPRATDDATDDASDDATDETAAPIASATTP
jgi:O-antigen ligase